MYTCIKKCKYSTSNLCINQIIKYSFGGPYLLLSNFSIICTVIKFDSHTTPMYNFNTEHQLRLPAQQAVETGGVQVAATSHSPQIGRKDAPWWPFHLPTPPFLAIIQSYPSYLTYFYISGVSGELFCKGFHYKKLQALPFDGDAFNVFIFFGSFLFFW